MPLNQFFIGVKDKFNFFLLGTLVSDWGDDKWLKCWLCEFNFAAPEFQ